MPRGYQSLVKDKRSQIETVDELEDKFQIELEEFAVFVEESARKRAAVIRSGFISEIESVIGAEVALASGIGRLDIVAYLMEKLHALAHMDATLASVKQREYEEIFGFDSEAEEK